MIEYSSTLLDALFENNPQPCFVFERQSLKIVAANAAACALYGWPREELVQLTLREIRPAEDLPRMEHTVAQRRDVPGNFTRMSRHKSRDGRVFDVEIDIRRVMFQDVPCSLAVVTEVSGASQTERRARLLIEASGDGLAVVATEGHFAFINPAGERILGYGPGELTATQAIDLAHPEDAKHFAAAMLARRTATVVSRSRKKDGTWIWIESTTTDHRLDPAIRGFISAFRDITPRVEVERVLRETTERLEYLLTGTAAVTYSARAGGEVATTFISANVRDVLGFESSRFLDSSFWRSRVHPDDLEIITMGLVQLYDHGEHTVRYRFQHADGSYRWLLDGARLHRDGDKAEIVGHVIDITERTRAEQALAESEASFRSVIERAPTMTFVHRDGTVLYANHALAERLRIPASELVGLNALEYIHPDDRAAVAQQILRTSDGDAAVVDARMLPRIGAPIVVRCAGVRAEFGGAAAHVVFCTDVTAERELYARMAIADRLMSLGTLAAGVAHEINNPLAFVIGNIELLARELPAIVAGTSRLPMTEVEALLSDARDGAVRVGTIVRDLRALSRNDDGRTSSVDIVPVLRSCLKMMHGDLRARARVVESFAPDLPPVAGNGSRLSQVFLNLLVNASHAIPEGRPAEHEIRVVARREREHVVLEVADTGAGIPAHVIGRIFDPFFTTKPVGQGTGLGLSISHEIVRSLGGTITVESTPGLGTAFRITLPAAQHAVAPAVAAAPPRAKTRVLLVDDELAVGRSIGALLAPDVEVVSVTRARDALDRIRRGESFDAILCDLAMPELPGDELYRMLEQTAPALASRVVFMSGGAPGVHAPEGRPLLEKPFTEAALRAALTSVASRA